jgi:hypothetical protein
LITLLTAKITQAPCNRVTINNLEHVSTDNLQEGSNAKILDFGCSNHSGCGLADVSSRQR